MIAIVPSKYGDLTAIDTNTGQIMYWDNESDVQIMKAPWDATFYSKTEVKQVNKGEYILLIKKYDKNTNDYKMYSVIISDKQEIYDLDNIFNNTSDDKIIFER